MAVTIKYNGQDITAQFKSGRWSHPETGVKYPANYPPEEIDGLTVETLPDPEPITPEPQPRTWTPRQFLRLFSDAKRLQIVELSMSNVQVKMWYDDLIAAQEVVENDADLLAGLAAMVQYGVLTQSEIDEALL